MIKHLIKLIWNQRRQNGWLFAELFIVTALLWFVIDKLFVEQYTYHQPSGYNIENCWRIELDKLSPKSAGFIPEEKGNANDYRRIEQLKERLMQTGKVESVAYSFYSCPYSPGNSYGEIFPLDADSVNYLNCHLYSVSPEFFDLFRVKDLDGNALTERLRNKENLLVLTDQTAKQLYKGGEAIRKEVRCSGTRTVAAIIPNVKESEYNKASNGGFIICSPTNLQDKIEQFGANGMDFNLRMKQPITVAEMSDWFSSLGDQLTAGNVYVSSFTSHEQMRIDRNKKEQQSMQAYLLFSTFLLLNVFFGIVGTFWLRTEQRKGETGLRIALGASRFKIGTWLNIEGLMLLYLSMPLLGLLILNISYADLIDTANMPFTWWRLLITAGASLLIVSLMIVIGVTIPARRAMKLDPSTVLKAE